MDQYAATPNGTLLTAREQDIVKAVAKGNSNKQIARLLGITEGTVKLHLHHIYRKLNIPGRTMLAISYMSTRQG